MNTEQLQQLAQHKEILDALNTLIVAEVEFEDKFGNKYYMYEEVRDWQDPSCWQTVIKVVEPNGEESLFMTIGYYDSWAGVDKGIVKNLKQAELATKQVKYWEYTGE